MQNQGTGLQVAKMNPLRDTTSYDTVWLVYGKDPGSLPRSWRGLVGYKRLDVILRVLLAALYPCGDVFRDSLLILFLDRGAEGEKGKLIMFSPACLPIRALYERDIGPLFLRALRGETCSSVDDVSFLYATRFLRRSGYRVIGFSEKGERLNPNVLREKVAIILGSYFDPPLRVLREADSMYSIGPYSYLASHVAAFINATRLGVIRLE